VSGNSEAVARNRRFFLGVLIACILVVALAAGAAIFKYAFDTVEAPPETRFDLASLFLRGDQKSSAFPDAKNPCIVVQEHLEKLRRRDYASAYKDLGEGLRAITSPAEFASNAQKNEPLLRDIESFSFPSYTSDGGSAAISGYIEYATGGRSRVDASLVKEGGRWKIALLTLIYQ
jgi:hypothetical protein